MWNHARQIWFGDKPSETIMRCSRYLCLFTSLAGMSVLWPDAYVAWMLLIGFLAYIVAVGIGTAYVTTRVLDAIFPIQSRNIAR